jgi:hypothetical protein
LRPLPSAQSVGTGNAAARRANSSVSDHMADSFTKSSAG